MWLDDLAQDLRFGLRSARRSPLYSLLAIVTIGLGIGVNTAVFGVVKSVLLDALPYTDASRLVRVYAAHNDPALGTAPLSAGVNQYFTNCASCHESNDPGHQAPRTSVSRPRTPRGARSSR